MDQTSGPCPIGRASGVLGDRWTLLIMRNAMLGHTRFEQFRTSLGIADNILANRLAKLVDAGLLNRTDYQDGNRTRQHYPITEAGAALRPILDALADWGHEYVNPLGQAPGSTVHTVCGQVSDDRSFCKTCNVPIPNSEAAWLMPWVSDDPIPLATAGK